VECPFIRHLPGNRGDLVGTVQRAELEQAAEAELFVRENVAPEPARGLLDEMLLEGGVLAIGDKRVQRRGVSSTCLELIDHKVFCKTLLGLVRLGLVLAELRGRRGRVDHRERHIRSLPRQRQRGPLRIFSHSKVLGMISLCGYPMSSRCLAGKSIRRWHLL
jgi:hypothetical protein